MATCRSPRYFFRMMTLLLWAFFFAAHARAVPNEIWITAVPHADGGSGTELDPFDGSTALKFDALLNSFQSSPGLIIHLGAGTFESDVTATLHWEVKPGWRVQGAGMDETTCKMVGNLAGRRWDHEFFKSAFHSSADHVVIRDLTVDCNWPGLSQTADVGLKGEKFAAIYAIDLRGSDILIENVRQINSYGSWANGIEAFGIRLSAPKNGDVARNTIRYCRAELPHGNYSAPFSLHGWVDPENPFLLTDSSVYGNVAIGENSQDVTGFTTGGVNGAFIKDCQVFDNTFIDCQSVFYQDTGTVSGLDVYENTLVRGWMGVGLVADNPAWGKDDIQITSNSFNVQNRVMDGASYGILINGATASNVAISKNSLTFDPAGIGYRQFYSIGVHALQVGSITDNIADEKSAGTGLAEPVMGTVHGYAASIAENKTSSGLAMTGLADIYIEPLAKALDFSTRGTVGTGENVLIQGFIVASPAPVRVLLRATGPSLGVDLAAHAMADPFLTLYDSVGAVVATNDDWQQTDAMAIASTGIPPAYEVESAILIDLTPGSYTAVMSGKSPTLGVGLLEVYDLTTDNSAALQNVSTRGLVGVGSNVMIGGIIIGPGQNPTIIARAIGPTLAAAGIQNPLSDPILELHDSNGALIESNGGWRETSAAAIEATGIPPSDDRECAIVRSLVSGNYTTIVRGKDGSTGIALVELYRAP